MLRIGLVAGDFRDAHTVLFTRADADRHAVLHVEHRVGRHARLDEPAEHEVGIFLLRREALDLVFPEGDFARFLVHDLAVAVGRHEVFRLAGLGDEAHLGDKAAVDEALEIDDRLGDEVGETGHVADAEDAQVRLRREEVHHAGRELGRHHDFGVVPDDELGRVEVAFAVEGDRTAEGRQAVRLVRAEVGLGQRIGHGDAAGVVVLHDDGARFVVEVAQDVERIVRIRHVRLARMLAALEELRHGGEVLARLKHLDVAQHDIAVDELVEGGFLARILAVAEALLLAADVPGDLFVAQRLALVTIDERNFHFRREMIGFNGFIGGFQVFHGR